MLLAPPHKRPTGARRTLRSYIRINDPWVFVLPYLAGAAFLIVYPVGYGFWIGRDPLNYLQLFGDPTYWAAAVNTLLFLGVGVNATLLLALVLSGFFALRRWWVKALLPVFILPWAVPVVSAYLSIHWMLNSEIGMINTILRGIGVSSPPEWLNSYGWAIVAALVSYIWHWLPFWTLILLAARMAIPNDVYEAADVDGATGIRRLVHITFPLLRGTYLTSTLLAAIWTLSDYNTVHFITGGAPGDTTHVLATLGVDYAFDIGFIELGVSVGLTALPLIIILIVLLVRRLKADDGGLA
ncbi:carbohydrate ABC transporter permease [Prauserella cavernicola]|uniref:Sugar ABC transporter permease n=1 Tax=Prauserella cavernicola TaxID=2800127 RepID=A0A934QWJ4_9PSEU|nr:sugar ABC transporter permease [Prauserella cavernicola]MBK1787472.1 sugar ABC transporter permease [Prauserella cavernicola]